ncbi:hydroxyacid dehydrogenase [Agromyces mediolanus]|uniref:2-hydroxyacid dehydrogenase n=1 Tax=Agromyces mediolanus TaxID=41986 RepID=A0A918CLB1_AGRME|nr:hydroxyacid dehydrogenase [Agromyces mediolanus]GGR27382.1 2-hydroxyacid dehydrogenase [Agromyces mediolanus]GLJ71917.1 2-hydroxyacid dehydrogenase [Agromyces mediolanus]
MRTDSIAGRARPRAAFVMRDGLVDRLFAPSQLAALDGLLEVEGSGSFASLAQVPPETEVLISGWGCPAITPAALERLPALRAIFHAAGTVKEHIDPSAWQRGILVTTAAAANALPVAEYTLASILLAGKGVPSIIEAYRDRPELDLEQEFPQIGNHRRRVGILGASKIGRRVIELLQPFDVEVLVSDPYLEADDPLHDQATAVGLEQLFAESEVLSVHAPLLPETVGLVSRELISTMPDGAVLINTSRAPIVDQDALVEAATTGRISAILDVTSPEPLPLDHALRSTPGIVLTPHVAGALGNELHRLGAQVVDEVRRYVAGEPAVHPVGLADLAAMA